MNSILLLFFSFFIPCYSFQHPNEKIELCQTGCHHAEEVTVDLSASWFGIYKINAGDGYEIRKVHPYQQPCHDPLFDNENDRLSGREILIKENQGSPIILIGGFKMKEGKMKVGYINNPRCLFPGDFLKINFDEQDYTIMATGKIELDTANHSFIPLIENYRVLIVKETGNKPIVQELFSIDRFRSSDEVHPQILFAGDIDGDGQPDLLYNISGDYNLTDITLFLSSEAGPGKLVKQVASWKSTGC